MLNRLPKDIVNIIYSRLHNSRLFNLHKEYHSKVYFKEVDGFERYYYNCFMFNWRHLNEQYYHHYFDMSKNTRKGTLPKRYHYSNPK